MAARKRIWTPEVVRQRIQSAMLVKALQDHVLGKNKMLPTQVQAALGLLKKTTPDMHQSAVTITRVKRKSYADRAKDPATASVSPPAEAVEHTVQ